jgi:hypothetical protein
LWSAAKRDDYHLLFSSNRRDKAKIVSSKDINTLITIISRSEDNTPKGVEEYIKEQSKNLYL